MNPEFSFNAPFNAAEIAAPLDAEPRGAASTSFMPMLGVVAVIAVAIPLTLSLNNAAYSPFASSPKSPAFIAWRTDFEAAQRQALAEGKSLMVAFYKESCPNCQWMDQEVYSRAPIIVEAQSFVSVKINAEIRTDLAQRYHIQKYPSLVWVDARGNEQYRADGSLNGYELYNAMQRNH